MTPSAWREVKLSPNVLDKLVQGYEGYDPPASEDQIIRDTLRYAIEYIREEWDRLPQTPDGVRRFDFVGDDFPVIVFYAELESTNLYDLAIVEEIVNIFDVHIITTPR